MELTSCPSGKIRHATRDGAHDHLTSLNRSGRRRGEAEVYRCRACGGWHVGRLIAKRANEARARAAGASHA